MYTPEILMSLVRFFNKGSHSKDDVFLREINLNAPLENIQDDIKKMRLVDRAQVEVMFDFYRRHDDYKEFSDDEIYKTIIDNLKPNMFLGYPTIHQKYIHKINTVYQKPYIKDYEDLQNKYILQDFINLQIVNDAKNSLDIPEDLRKNQKSLKNKYALAKMHYLVPMRDMEGRKILGMLKPTIQMCEFWHEDIVFIGPEIITELFSVRGLEFLEGNTEESQRTPGDYVNTILQFMMDRSYTDLNYYMHDYNNYAVIARKDGVLESLTQRMSISSADKITEALLGRMEKDRKTTDSIVSGKIMHKTNTGRRSYRVEMARQSKDGVSSAKIYRTVDIRLLSDISFIKDFNNLRYGEKATAILQEVMLANDGGMYLVAGEVNSGKSTTLFALLYYAYKALYTVRNKLVKVLIADKVKEYDVDGFIQFDMYDTANTKDPITFPKISESALRQDLDIFGLGEVRSQEDIQALIKMANRGSPVFATVHATNAEEVINVLENNGGMERRYFANNLRLILHVDLEPAVCQECSGQGCQKCEQTGINGKVPIFDLVYIPRRMNNKGFSALKDDIYDLERLGKEGKLLRITKQQRAEELFEQGMISDDTYNKYSGVLQQRLEHEFSKGRDNENA